MKGIKTLLLVLSSLVVSAWTIYLLYNPIKYALAALLFLMTFVSGKILLDAIGAEEDTVESKIHISGFAHYVSQMFPPVLLAVFLFAIALIPPIEGEIFVAWPSLALPNMLRLIAAFSLNFLPGYCILGIAGKRREISGLSGLISSFLLSFLVMAIVGFVSAYVQGIVGGLFFVAFLSTNFALVVACVFSISVRLALRGLGDFGSQGHVKAVPSKLPLLLLVLILLFEVVFWFLEYANIGFFIGGPGTDMWRLHGFAQSFTDYRAFDALHLPWWFNLYLACFFVLSGIPSVNAYFALFPLMVMSGLSFYLMASSVFRSRKVGGLATLAYSLFSGSAWVYSVYLRGFEPVTDVSSWGSVLSAVGNKFLAQGWYPPFALGFIPSLIAYACLWWMLYAVFRVNIRDKFNFFLLGSVFALSYVVHGVEPIIFVVFLLALLVTYLFTQNLQGLQRVRWAAFSGVFALIVVSMIDLSLTSHYDAFNKTSIFALSSRYYYFNSPSFYAIFAGIATILALTYIKFDIPKLVSTSKSAFKRLRLTRIHLIELVFFIYVISIILWAVFFPSYNLNWMNLGDIPWYVYPATGGVLFFLTIIGAAYLVNSWEKLEKHVTDVILFCLLSLGALFLVGDLVSFVNARLFYTNFWERRVLSYTQGIFGLVAAFIIVTIFRRLQIKTPYGTREVRKVTLASSLLLILVIGGLSSTLLAADYASLVFFRSSISEDELEALNYLHYELPTGLKTAYVGLDSGTKYIRAFANDKWEYDPALYLGQYEFSLSTLLDVIALKKVQLLYVHHTRDSKALERNLFLQQLIRVLPIAFNNSDVTIYYIPSVRRPSVFSPLGLVRPNEASGIIYDAYALWLLAFALGDSSYKVGSFSDYNILNGSEVIVASYDPLPSEGNATTLLEWVTNGGHLVISNTRSFGIFSELLGLTPKLPLVNCDTKSDWNKVGQNGEQPIVETVMKIEGKASLRLRNNLTTWETWIYTAPTPMNLSDYQYLGIWVYSTGGGPRWLLYLEDSNKVEGSFKYDLSTWDPVFQEWFPSFTGWKLHLIPIRQYFSSLNLSSVSKLRITAGPYMPTDFLIDDIFALKEESEEKPFVTINGLATEEIIDLPTFQVQNLSLSGKVTPIANYTNYGIAVAPFALYASIGEGKVTYLNINMLYDFILSKGSELESPYKILAQVLKMVNATV